MTWDEERALEIIDQACQDALYPVGYTKEFDSFKKMVELLGKVRMEAVGWTWTEACSQHDRGMDPRFYEMSNLVKKSLADLNPERDKQA